MDSFQPSQKILDNYADVLINCALNSGAGVQPNEVVFLQVPECAKPMLISLRRAILKAGAHPIINYTPDDMEREFYDNANDAQLSFFPAMYLKGRVDQVDHFVSIIADTDLKELEGISPHKLMARQIAMRPYREWRDEKENKGKMTWTLALYGTHAMAEEAHMTLEEYWGQIIDACYLNETNPVQKWREIMAEIERVKKNLNDLKIESLTIEGPKVNLTIGLGKNRQWMGGTGRNIPSYEVFISPDWRKTNGTIQFNQPLYRYGNLITDISLEFKEGRVIKATASQGEKVLQEMIAVENADKVGEFSLTDARISKITKFMAETLFDENQGGPYGNTHIALGSAYKDSYTDDPSKITKEQWAEFGYNESVIHTDIVSTDERTVTATLPDGSKKVIYQNGQFCI